MALQQINRQIQVYSLACPKFVPLVESGEWDSHIAQRIIEETLEPLKGKKMDTLILGCTHYPLLEPHIQKVMGDKINIISSGDETAREASTILHHYKMLNRDEAKAEHVFYTTGSPCIFARIASRWLKKPIINVKKISL